MIKALLIDDEVRATDSLKLLIERFIPDISRVWICNNVEKAAPLIHQINPDLVFLDIRMPHLSGFEMLDLIPNKYFKVIFTTAYDEYAIQSIRFSAFDYLLKPIDVEELINAVKRYSQTKDDWLQHQELFQNIAVNMQLLEKKQFSLAIPAKDGVHFLLPGEIIHCEAEGNYTRFYTINGKQHITSRTLGEYEDLLSPYHFIRCHNSHLVNRSFISFIDNEGFIILKGDGRKVDISRRRKAAVIAELKSYC